MTNEEVIRLLQEDLRREKTPEELAWREKFEREVLSKLVQFGDDMGEDVKTPPTTSGR